MAPPGARGVRLTSRRQWRPTVATPECIRGCKVVVGMLQACCRLLSSLFLPSAARFPGGAPVRPSRRAATRPETPGLRYRPPNGWKGYKYLTGFTLHRYFPAPARSFSPSTYSGHALVTRLAERKMRRTPLCKAKKLVLPFSPRWAKVAPGKAPAVAGFGRP